MANVRIVMPNDGQTLVQGGFGVVAKLTGADTGGSVAIVEHPLAPGILGAPPHSHEHEDEISYILEGEITVMIGDEVVTAPAGAYVVKPRGVSHTFWNSSQAPARLLEIIAPAGFAAYFTELGQMLAAPGPPDMAAIGALAGRFGMTMYPERLPEIMQTYGVRLG